MINQLLAAEGFSEVNNALFDSPHMQNINNPGRLNYRYKRIDSGDQPRQDTVSIEITNITESGRTDQAYHFFTGEHKRPYQDRKNVTGNAIFMLFLESDVHELQRQTGGSWRHFQRRIRWALAAGATKNDLLIPYQGKDIKATQYIIQPYANDDQRARYGPFAYKYYAFTLSDEIPGTIYEVRSIVPEAKTWKEGDEFLADERITFTGFIPDQAN